MRYESHWLFTATATALAKAAPGRVTREPSTQSVAPCPAPTRRTPRRSFSSTARRAAWERSASEPASPTVRAWFTSAFPLSTTAGGRSSNERSEEHTSELQSLRHLVCRLLL